MFFSKYREKIKNVVQKRFIPFLLFSFAVYFGMWFCKIKLVLPEFAYNAVSLFFTTTLIFVTYKIQLKNKLLALLGKNVFQIYIMQHLPMEIFKPIQSMGYVKKNIGGGVMYYIF